MKRLSNKYTAKVVKDPETGDTLLEFDQKFLEEQDWREGDTIKWNITDKEVSMTNVDAVARKETDYYLVETISLFRIRYVVKAKSAEHASDEVVMNLGNDNTEFKEFSQHHLDEVVSQTKKMTREEVLELCDQDNDYLTSWSDEQKLKNLTNTIKYEV
ncbi:hypothetical protein EB118_11735 [bacterium]|nr:hypothetical protein [bacterium]